jgi:hypothetical protein
MSTEQMNIEPKDDTKDETKIIEEVESDEKIPFELLLEILKKKIEKIELINKMNKISDEKKVEITKCVSSYLKVSSNLYQSENNEENKQIEYDYKVPEHCIPISGDIRLLNWEILGNFVQFDVITMDPPWQLGK